MGNTMNNIFKTMVELQHKFNKQVAEDYLDKNFNWNSAIIVESGELLESLGYKWWKKQIPDMDNVKVEAIDLLHFVISDTLNRNYIIDKTSPNIIEDTVKEFTQYFTEDLFYPELEENEISILIDKLNFDDYGRFAIMKNLFKQLSMTNEDIYIAYIVKNCLNKFRQDNGYKEGTYVKIWNGREDNIVAYEVAKAIGTCEQLFDLLYRNLETYYKEDN